MGGVRSHTNPHTDSRIIYNRCNCVIVTLGRTVTYICNVYVFDKFLTESMQLFTFIKAKTYKIHSPSFIEITILRYGINVLRYGSMIYLYIAQCHPPCQSCILKEVVFTNFFTNSLYKLTQRKENDF